VTNQFAALTKEQFMETLFPDHALAFSDIPVELLDEDVIIRWLRGASGLATKRYLQIPMSWLTERVLLYAGSEGVPVLKHIKPDQVENYFLLVTTCADHDYTAMADVDPSFQDDRLIESVLLWETAVNQVKLLREIAWIGEKMSKELLIKYSLNDVNFFLGLPPKLFPQNADEYFNLEDALAIHNIRARGRLDLIAGKILRGGWPDSEKVFLRFPKPESLDGAVEHLLNAPPGQYIETLYVSCVMTYPIEQVVPAMKGNRLKSLLLEMYSVEALKPFLKTDVDLKGAMLERALGL
jgi:hypothetical protein